MTTIVLIFMLAVVVEGLVEYVKSCAAQAGRVIPALAIQITALVAAVGLALLTGADIFAELGIMLGYPVVGVVITGVFLSRGSNYMSDLIGRLRNGGGVYASLLEDDIITSDKE